MALPRNSAHTKTKTVEDQLGREVTVSWPPKRIVSLVPSQTELLFDLGLDEEVVGLTTFCVHPREKHKALPKMGGTKKVHKDRVDAVKPDLIIGNKEENDRDQILELAAEYPVWLSDVRNLEDAYEMITKIATLVDRAASGQKIVNAIQEARTDFKNKLAGLESKPKVAYVIWRRPYMVVGSDTFINHMIGEAGFENVFADQSRYPEISPGELQQKAPDLLFLSSEPFPFREKHFAEFQEICPASKIMIVDGELFSWYGSRLLKSYPYFSSLRKSL